MNRILSAFAAAAVTAGTFAVATQAQAAPVGEVFSISLEGLDSADPADSARIDRRIRTAAQSFCGSDRIQPARMRDQAMDCEEAVTAKAQSAVSLASGGPGDTFRVALRVR